jgi:hypothetical protein
MVPGCWSGSNGKVPAFQAQGLEFNAPVTARKQKIKIKIYSFFVKKLSKPLF